VTSKEELNFQLFIAAKNGHTDIVKMLLAAGADGHAWDDYALRSAVKNGHTDVVDLLKQRKDNT